MLTWTNLGAFQPGQLTNITVIFTATSAAALATNSVTVLAAGGRPTPAPPPSPSRRARARHHDEQNAGFPANGQAGVGQTVQYNLQIVNSGYTTLTNLSLTDKLSGDQLQLHLRRHRAQHQQPTAC